MKIGESMKLADIAPYVAADIAADIAPYVAADIAADIAFDMAMEDR